MTPLRRFTSASVFLAIAVGAVFLWVRWTWLSPLSQGTQEQAAASSSLSSSSADSEVPPDAASDSADASSADTAAGEEDSTAPAFTQPDGSQPYSTEENMTPIPNEYVFTLVSDTATVEEVQQIAEDVVAAAGGTLHHVYADAIKGFSAYIPEGNLDSVRADPRIAGIGQDMLMSPNASTRFAVKNDLGVNRIGAKLTKDGADGSNVSVAVIDSGLYRQHPFFAGKHVQTVNCGGTGADADTDQLGHGTHVTGTVLDIAPAASLHVIRVASRGESTFATRNLLCAMDYVIKNHIQVVTMSLGNNISLTYEQLMAYNDSSAESVKDLANSITKAIGQGTNVIVSAGNLGIDTRTVFPANTPGVVIVASIKDTDGLPCAAGGYGDDTASTFSNFGSTGNVVSAPGEAIMSTWNNGSYRAETGTSMAAPFVAGAVALYLQRHPGASSAQVLQALISSGESSLSDLHDCRSGYQANTEGGSYGPVVRVDELLKAETAN